MQDRSDFGSMKTISQRNTIPEGITIGIDNECFKHPEKFGDGEAYLEMIRSFSGREILFATAPDVVGDWEETLPRSTTWFEPIREAGAPPALVAQDGATPADVPWTLFDVLFIGGTTEWKLGPEAARLVEHAKTCGTWVHMGRVNSRKRLRYAAEIGCDSADGTLIAFGPDVHLPRVLKWLDEINEVQSLDEMRQSG